MRRHPGEELAFTTAAVWVPSSSDKGPLARLKMRRGILVITGQRIWFASTPLNLMNLVYMLAVAFGGFVFAESGDFIPVLVLGLAATISIIQRMPKELEIERLSGTSVAVVPITKLGYTGSAIIVAGVSRC